MIRIRAVCPDCGPVSLARSQVRLVISSHPGASRYSFTCPRCRAWISKPADPPVVSNLVGLVPMVHETRPAELDEPHTGPPLSVDDLLDLGLEMAGTDLLAAYVTPV